MALTKRHLRQIKGCAEIKCHRPSQMGLSDELIQPGRIGWVIAIHGLKHPNGPTGNYLIMWDDGRVASHHKDDLTLTGNRHKGV